MASPAVTLPGVPSYDEWRALNEVNSNIQDSLSAFQVTLTSAQLLALKTTAVAVSVKVNAANATEVLVVRAMHLHFKVATTAYTLNAGTLKFFYGPVANAHPITADLSAMLTGTVDRYSAGIAQLGVINDVAANMLGQQIFLGNDGGANYTLGDGTLTATVLYSKTNI